MTSARGRLPPTDSADREAEEEEVSDAKAALALYEIASPMRDLTDTEAQQEELDELQLGRSAYEEANRATAVTEAEAHAEEAEESSVAWTLTRKRQRSEQRLLEREEIRDAEMVAEMEAEKRRDAVELEAALEVSHPHLILT